MRRLHKALHLGPALWQLTPEEEQEAKDFQAAKDKMLRGKPKSKASYRTK